MTIPESGGKAPARRGGLIVRVPEAETTLGPWLDRYLPIWHLGVPAHVTLLFPFLKLAEIDPASLADLHSLFARTPSIMATFDRIGQFPDVLYLAPKPSEWFVRLTEALSNRFGLLPYGGQFDEIVPHLTVARHADPSVLAEISAALTPLLPIETLVREVWLIEEEQDGHWRHAATFPLKA